MSFLNFNKGAAPATPAASKASIYVDATGLTHVIDATGVDNILTDMRLGTAYDADNLPLMQHALLFLWQKAIESGLPGTTRPDATGSAPMTK